MAGTLLDPFNIYLVMVIQIDPPMPGMDSISLVCSRYLQGHLALHRNSLVSLEPIASCLPWLPCCGCSWPTSCQKWWWCPGLSSPPLFPSPGHHVHRCRSGDPIAVVIQIWRKIKQINISISGSIDFAFDDDDWGHGSPLLWAIAEPLSAHSPSRWWRPPLFLWEPWHTPDLLSGVCISAQIYYAKP